MPDDESLFWPLLFVVMLAITCAMDEVLAGTFNVNDWQESAMQSAVELSGYEHDGDYPRIILVPDDLMSEYTGCNNEQCGDPQAWFDYEKGELLIGASIATTPEVFARGLLVHEYVHYLQYPKDGSYVNFCQGVLWEKEAREIQIQFLIGAGVTVPLRVNMPWDSKCNTSLTYE